VNRLTGGLRRALHWGERTLQQIYDTETPPLSDDEYVIRDGPASLLRGFFGNRGRLFLTTHRIIFLSMRSASMPNSTLLYPRIEVTFSDIERVERRHWLRRLWSHSPGLPLFSVILRDGRSYTFQIHAAGQWRSDIEQWRRGKGVRGMRTARPKNR
jgi:hypothetical protein